MLKFYQIPNAHCVIIERLGKYARTQKAGLRFYVRGLEQIKRLDTEGSHWGDVANKESFLIELSEQNTNTHGSKAYTKDNVEVAVDASIFWQIINAKDAVYESDCLPMAIRDRAIGVLRASIGVFDFDELSSKREQLSRDTTEALVESGKKWGVKFTRVEIQQLQTDGKTHEALLQQVEADRRKKAIIAEAEGNAERIRLSADANKIEALTSAEADEQVQILKARGKKEAISLESEGKANQILNVARAQAEALHLTRHSEKEYLQEIAEIVGPAEAAKLLMAQKYIDGFDNISRNPSNKVFLPNNFAAAFNINLDPAAPQQSDLPSPAEKPQAAESAPPERRRREEPSTPYPELKEEVREEVKPTAKVSPLPSLSKAPAARPAPLPVSPGEKIEIAKTEDSPGTVDEPDGDEAANETPADTLAETGSKVEKEISEADDFLEKETDSDTDPGEDTPDQSPVV
ncbi:MAG: SPFH/Band 7/PHB domain protein [Verrucomicrobiales bacterium]|nr:SPFH/Band 7/PHB domain protein [Verrucomicrobiales bacterium]